MDELSIAKILATLPHRYPFLLIDRVIEYRPFESIRALKNVSINEPFFAGHFPEHPIMPGVLILESMAQATGMLAFYSNRARSEEGNVYYLVGVDKARFKRPVTAGDQLILHAELRRQIKGIYRFEATAEVDGVLVASAEFMTTERARTR
jgi:3-hydroxyacyl-[acyl-carrier-protein] dehydratase